MTSRKMNFSGPLKAILGSLALMGILTVASPGKALALTGTAANTVIGNTVYVDYQDAGNHQQPQINASVDVTVALKSAAPTLIKPADQTIPSGTEVTYTYTITNNSNGPETYNLTEANSPNDGNITPGSVTMPATITLGATSVVSVSGTTITVPSGTVNGIAGGNTVVIGSNTYSVSSVDTANSTITVTDPGSTLAADATAGTQIGQQGTFDVKYTPVTTVNGDTFTDTITATSQDTAASTDNKTNTTTVTLAVLTVHKYVRNINATAACTGQTNASFPPVTTDTGLGAGSGTYCDAGVTGKPGETLEYLIIVSNTGDTDAHSVIIQDAEPAYTTKVADKIALSAPAVTGAPGAFTSTGTDAVDGDFAKTSSGTVYIYGGTGGKDDGTGGTLPNGDSIYAAFRASIE